MEDKTQMLTDEIKSVSSEIKGLNEKHEKGLHDVREDMKALGDRFDAYDQAKIDKQHDELDKDVKALNEKQTDLKELVADLEIAMKNAKPGNAPVLENEAHTKSFANFLRKGELGIDQDDRTELKALSVGTDAGAGYLAPKELSGTIVEKLTLISPIRSVANVISTDSKEMEFIREDGIFSAEWKGEGATRNETTGTTFDTVSISPQVLTARVDITDELLADNKFDLEGYLARKAARRFAKAEGLAFVKGTGSTNHQPEGFATGTDISVGARTQVLANSTANGNAQWDVTTDLLLDLIHSVDTDYRANGTFAFHGNTLRRIRGLKAGDGTYIFQTGFSGQSGVPDRILGHSYIECPDMDQFGATNRRPIYFGDFEEAYYIVDREGMQVRVDPYTAANVGAVKIMWRYRVSGGKVNPTALKYITTATA